MVQISRQIDESEKAVDVHMYVVKHMDTGPWLINSLW